MIYFDDLLREKYPNTDQKNSVFGHISRSVYDLFL